MSDTQTLVLIHAIAWPILIWLLSKTRSHGSPMREHKRDFKKY